MRAFSTASGGVFFAPEKIERKTTAVSYNEIVAEEPIPSKPRFFEKIFGKHKKAEMQHTAVQKEVA